MSSKRYRIIKSLFADTAIRYSMLFPMMFGKVTGTVTFVWTHPAYILVGCVFFPKGMTFGFEHTLYLGGCRLGFWSRCYLWSRQGRFIQALKLSPSPLEGTGGNLLVGYGDLVFCAEI